MNRNLAFGRAALALIVAAIFLLLPGAIAAERWRSFRENRDASVESRPSSTRLSGNVDWEERFGLGAFACAGLVLLGFAGWSIGRGALATRREVALLKNGVATEGRAVSAAADAVVFEYQYSARTAPEESLRTFAGKYVSLGRTKRTILVGDAVPVVYDPLEPENSTLDLFALRRDGEPSKPINRS